MKGSDAACIVVADQGEARLYLLLSPASLRLVARHENPAAHLHDRDLKSDRPGRVYNSAAAPRGRRGAMAHHATGGERTPRRQLAAVFARRIAREIAAAAKASPFDRLILVAEPRFLGTLRKALPAGLRAKVTTQIASDLMHLPAAQLRARVTAAAKVSR
ncbi:MAG TPA: host attachment protein [Steroidobacteraceae bacterium]